MKGNPDVIACLKELLRGEPAARDQYFIHSRRYEDQGLFALYERLNHEMEESPACAAAPDPVPGGDPDMRPHATEPGKTVEMLQKDLDTNTPFGTISPPA